MLTPKPIIWQGPGGTGFAILTDARACPRCHRMAMIVVNRDGQTLCTDCDAQRDRTRRTPHRR